MSTFNGKPAEIQRLSIDRFDGDNLLSTCFMLSHCHTDHMEGILDPRFISRLRDTADVFLYCSAITAAILRHSGLSSVAHKLTELPVEGASLVRVPATGGSGGGDDEIAVTMIPAGHCPGSVMFLLESSQGVVLYTGDFRLLRGDVSRLRALHNGDGTPRCISALYLDTTFLTSRGRRSFPTRDESAREVCRLVGEWIRRGERHIVNIRTSARYGSEFLFARLHDALGVRVHVSPALHRVYRAVPDICRAVTDDPRTPVHACRARDQLCGAVRDPGLSVRTVVPSALYWHYNAPEDGRVSMVEGNRCRVAYSCHSSHEEIEHVVSYLRPSKIEPCVVPQAMTRGEVVNICNEFLDGYRPASPSGVEGRGLSSLAGRREVTTRRREVTTRRRAACSVQRVKSESSDEDDDEDDGDDENSCGDSHDSSPPPRHFQDDTLRCVSRGTCEDDSSLPSTYHMLPSVYKVSSDDGSTNRVLPSGNKVSSDDDSTNGALPCGNTVSSDDDSTNHALPFGNTISSDDDSPISSPGRPSAHGPVLPMRWVKQTVGVSTKLLAELPTSDVGPANSIDGWACVTNHERRAVSGQADCDRLSKRFKSS